MPIVEVNTAVLVRPLRTAGSLSFRGNFGTDRLDLSNKYHQGRACCRGQPLVALVTHDRRQLGEPE